MSNPTVGEFALPENPQPPKNNNIKWIAGAIVVGLGFFGYVVQTENNSQPAPAVQQTTPTPAPKPAPAPSYSDDDFSETVYIKAVHYGYPDSKYATDGELLELGYDACEVFDSGVTVDEYASYFTLAFEGDEDALQFAATIGGAAIGALCPKHSWMLE